LKKDGAGLSSNSKGLIKKRRFGDRA